jgi:uncharacterized protein
MLPPTIPIFPLPNVVLFPNVFLPLHIFEPRYRDMVPTPSRGTGIIGMVLLRPGSKATTTAARRSTRSAARAHHHAERLPDGRYNIVLRGLEKFRIRSEDDSRSYRLARVDALIEPMRRSRPRGAAHRAAAARGAPRPAARGPRRRLHCPPSMSDDELVNALAQYLELEPVEKQALLERHGLLARCRSLIELLEMKVLIARHDWGVGYPLDSGRPYILGWRLV